MSDHEHHGPAHLAHHFETPEQQFESGKLGMWVFLATEILMFGGLFCAYAIYRGTNPDVFLFAHQVLDTKWGAINTVVLLASSFTMAWGVRASQLGQRNLLVTMLFLTLIGGGGFMVIKTIEYNGKWKHVADYETGSYFSLFAGEKNAFHPYNSDEMLEDASSYISHHGHGDDSHGEGHGEGHHEDHHDEHAADHEDHVDDAHADQGHDEHHGPEPASGTWLIQSASASAIQLPAQQPQGLNEAFATGEDREHVVHAGSHYPLYDELDNLNQGRTHVFFQIYFMMTGLHGLHVLIGMAAIGVVTYLAGGPLVKALIVPASFIGLAAYFGFFGWLVGFNPWIWGTIGVFAVLALAIGGLNFARLSSFGQGLFSPEYYTPVDLVGLYWHLVDLIWIFLFPLLYLIH